MKNLTKKQDTLIIATIASFFTYFIVKDFEGIINGVLLALGLR
jgi:hypothetical protein